MEAPQAADDRSAAGSRIYLTYARIALVPIVVALLMGIRPERLDRGVFERFSSPGWPCPSSSSPRFPTSSDGYSRAQVRRGQLLRKFIDPLADKLLSTAGS
jgi:hypothetical protein